MPRKVLCPRAAQWYSPDSPSGTPQRPPGPPTSSLHTACPHGLPQATRARDQKIKTKNFVHAAPRIRPHLDAGASTPPPHCLHRHHLTACPASISLPDLPPPEERIAESVAAGHRRLRARLDRRRCVVHRPQPQILRDLNQRPVGQRCGPSVRVQQAEREMDDLSAVPPRGEKPIQHFPGARAHAPRGVQGPTRRAEAVEDVLEAQARRDLEHPWPHHALQ
mmetsp:Transcript_22790/g.56273  ORF Transcript_22790/g.56273 Transcript_22790/m.56273 type:complete len:221 (+) Transcript_22790:68-730(+)